MAHPPPTATDVIDMWKTENSKNYSYYEKVENLKTGFWAVNSKFRKFFDQMDLQSVVEIAAGKGRHTAMVAPICGHIWATDTSVDAIRVCGERFKTTPNVSVALVSGDSSLPMIEPAAATAVFSYDAMVHFEMLTVAAYLTEISRILRPGGMALLHHSNYGANPTGRFTDNPGWRNFMTMDIIRHLASRNELKIINNVVFPWRAPESDALTLFQRD